MDTFSALSSIGQSLWLENTTREQLLSGSLIQHIQEGRVTGASIQPLACSRALRATEVYDPAIRKKLAAGMFGEALALELLLEDARLAADLLRPVYDRTVGVDGWVALAIFPPPAGEALAAVKRTYARAGRPNILLALPGMPDYLQAIEEVIYSGVPVKIEHLLSRAQFSDAARAYLRAIERRIAAGLRPAVAAFASVSISRLAAAFPVELTDAPLTGSVLAVARRIYQISRDLHTSTEWERAYNAGARPLRLVWAMEAADGDRRLHETLLEGLAAPLTVATLTENFLQAIAGRRFRGAPMPADSCDSGSVDLAGTAARLQHAGVAALIGSWIELLDSIACKSALIANS